ncbi:ABC transporter ATP-binding protein [Nocardioides sp. zg-ZUI104]|uniref:ABC transporter ATP-binding protein n=1 Tax=Nocardioides faecalis TaxID=2803858 RepID=UPI001BCB2C30|nr:ABC transporter ATP-binding protein [Nocardioides faecalis]MBS4752069.1 ABC transporter ATP-binding protein [Nocardioides faecalis]
MGLSLRGVQVRFEGVAAVDDVDLDVADGTVLAVLGPSGCGKSTLLRAVAGLERLAAGRIGWDGADLAATPTHRRGFALMFQDGQLFDHLSVARNVAYARRLRRGSRATAAAEASALLELVGLPGYDDRMPRTLSGGERQRVALARSLAARPRLLLLDEPLSALDAELRARLAGDLRTILAETGTTALMVTHDQAEAFAVADRVAVMRAGRIVQEGPTGQVWRAPADAATALFLGYSRVLDGAAAATVLRAAGLVAPDASDAPAAGGAAVAVRASGVLVTPAAPSGTPGGCGLPGVVRSVRPTPDGARLVVDVPGVGELDAVAAPGTDPRDDPGTEPDVGTDADAGFAPGAAVVVRVTREGCAVLPPPG